MNEALQTISILTSIGVVIVLLKFIPSYFNEKGRLLAQKQDIEEITAKVESIKTEFGRDLEGLKSNLQKLLAYEVAHRNEERNAIISFHSEYSHWHYTILETNIQAFSKADISKIEKRIEILEAFYKSCGISLEKVRLLVKNEQVRKTASQMFANMIALKTWISIELITLQSNFKEQLYNTSDLNKILLEVIYEKEAIKKIAEKDDRLRTEEITFKNAFFQKRDSKMKELDIIQLEVTFYDLFQDYSTSAMSSV